MHKRIKNNELDIVIVVGMLLTGFDHKRLNTLYVDKNLRYQELIQVFSRTNRVFNASKSYGNIVSFRNLKSNVDKALELFGNKEKNDIVLKKPYNQVRDEFKALWAIFKNKYKNSEYVLKLRSEEGKIAFVKNFRELLKLKSSLETYVDFSYEDVDIESEDEWLDYISVYQDIYNDSKTEDAPIRQIDFSLELIKKDLVNYDYIVKLLIALKVSSLSGEEEYEYKKEEFLKQFDKDIRLRDKKKLIQEFIETRLLYIDKDGIKKEFDKFWNAKKEIELKKIANVVDAKFEKLQELIQEYEFSGKFPKNDDIISALNKKPSILVRNKIAKQIKTSIVKLIELFEW